MGVERWDWATADADDRRAFHALAVAHRAEVGAGDAPLPFEALVAEMDGRARVGHGRRWVAREGGSIVGSSCLWWEDTGANERLAGVEIAVLPDGRKRGVGRELLRPVVEHAVGIGRTTLTVEVADGTAGEGFARATGWRRFSSERISRLATRSVDRALLGAWSAPVPGYELAVWEGPTPEDLLEGMAVLRHAENDTPWGDLDVEDDVFTPDRIRAADAAYAPGGKERWTVAATSRSGKGVAAYTQLFLWPGWDGFALQDWTAVDRAHRGVGLAKWVKAVNMLRLLDARPAVATVDTSNNVDNVAMLAINVGMGFRPLYEYGCWTIDATAVR